MPDKTFRSFDPMDDLRTDYLLIAIGIGAAVIALIYLISI
jgi:hypothetical protein